MGRKPTAEHDASMKVIDILEAFIDGGRDGLRLTEVTQSTDLNKSTVHRILLALTERGYLHRNEATKKYTMGYKAMQFSRIVDWDRYIIDISRPFLAKLRQLTGETVQLMKLDGHHAVYIDKIDTVHAIGLLTYVGKHTFLHATAGGKAILACQNEEIRNKLLTSAGLPALTPRTLTDPVALSRQLELARTDGIAWNRSEDRDDIVAIAAPIRNRDGEVSYSISIAGPSYRFTESHAAAAADALRAVAGNVSALLGDPGIQRND